MYRQLKFTKVSSHHLDVQGTGWAKVKQVCCNSKPASLVLTQLSGHLGPDSRCVTETIKPTNWRLTDLFHYWWQTVQHWLTDRPAHWSTQSTNHRNVGNSSPLHVYIHVQVASLYRSGVRGWGVTLYALRATCVYSETYEYPVYRIYGSGVTSNNQQPHDRRKQLQLQPDSYQPIDQTNNSTNQPKKTACSSYILCSHARQLAFQKIQLTSSIFSCSFAKAWHRTKLNNQSYL